MEELEKDQFSERRIDRLADSMDVKLFVSAYKIDWEEAGGLSSFQLCLNLLQGEF